MVAQRPNSDHWASVANRLPHCGASITLLAICKLNHRESYADIAAVTMLFPLPALVLVLVLVLMLMLMLMLMLIIVLGTVFGSF